MENVVADSYDLTIYGLEPDGYVKAMRAGTIDLFERELVLGGEGVNLEVEIAANGGKIEGEVTRSGGAAVSGAQVVLMPISGRNGMILSKQTVADESGHFLLRGIAPGSYELYSWAEIENGRWWDAEFLASVKNRATSLKVEGTATAAVKLTIIE